MRKVRVGLLGLGVVGSAVARAILDGDDMADRSGVKLEIRRVAVRSVTRARSVELPAGIMTGDPFEVVNDPDIDIVIEVMGGENPAFDLITAALSSGKHVVTANKEVLAKRGDELYSTVAVAGKRLVYEASVGGGIPILNTISDDLLGNRINSVRAIINGTTNYILTRMSSEGAPYDGVLADAQRLGYAEVDPTADVEGFDALYKIAIIGHLAFGASVKVDQIHREGISRIDARDFRYADELGFTIKLIAAAQMTSHGLLLRVHPSFVPLNVPMASVNGAMNMVEVEGDLVGPLWLLGAGAGPEPTASAVLGDVLRVARDMDRPQHEATRASNGTVTVTPMNQHECQYYLRLTALDKPGVLAQVAKVLGDANISIRSVIQMDADIAAGRADLVIMTHTALEANMQKAAASLRGLDDVAALDNLIRVESYNRPA
jgi:homoserine dehydrogenase